MVEDRWNIVLQVHSLDPSSQWTVLSVRSHGATHIRIARRRRPGAIDGIFGPVTKTVVRKYQTHSGLPVTGIMDERTWMAPAGAAGATLESLSGMIL